MHDGKSRVQAHKEAKHETLRVLTRIHCSLRTHLLDDEQLVQNGIRIASSTNEGQRFQEWLRTHHSNLTSDGNEQISDEFLAWAQKTWPLMVSEDSTRKAFLARLIELLNHSPASHAEFARLLASSIGLVFIRFSQTLRRWYYHWLLSDVIPDATRYDVMESLYVPEGAGTIGWVMRHGMITSGAHPDPKFITQPLWSCFIDPKGRVATEDLITGNRSWAGYPVIEGGEPIGLVFCFVPFDGLFVLEHATAESAHIRNASFVQCFHNSVDALKNELILALKYEAEAKLSQQQRRRAAIFRKTMASLGGHIGEFRSEGREVWLREMLFPKDVEPDDPLGFQVVINIEEEVIPGFDRPRLNNTVLMREKTFIDELFRQLQLSCLYPKMWSPHFAFRLEALHNLYHDGWDVGKAILMGDQVIPTWHVRDEGADIGRAPGWVRSSMRRLSELGFYPQSVGDIPDDVAEELSRELRRRHGPMSEDACGVEFQHDHCSLQTKDGLDLHSPANRVADLVVPLVGRPQLCELPDAQKQHEEHGAWCVGFFRIKCILDSRPDLDERGMSESVRRRFQGIYNCFHRDPIGAEALNATTDLLRIFEHSFYSPKTFAELKILLDLRFVACEAIVQDITRSLCDLSQQRDATGGDTTAPRDGDAPVEDARLNLVEKAVILADLEDRHLRRTLLEKVARCKAAVLNLSGQLRQLEGAGKLPAVSLVSLWLSRKRPVLKEHHGISEKELAALLSRDPGLPQLLRLYARWTTVDGEPIAWPRTYNTDLVTSNDAEPVSLGRHVFLHSHNGKRVDSGSMYSESTDVPLFVPPAFDVSDDGGDGAREFSAFECKQMNGECVSKLHSDNRDITLHWQFERFPEPVAVDFVPGRIKDNLLRMLQTDHAAVLTPSARKGEIDPNTLHPLSAILVADAPASQGQGRMLITRLNTLVTFICGDVNPEWRYAGFELGNSGNVILAYGDLRDRGRREAGRTEREPDRVKRLRDSAIHGVFADLWLLLHSSASRVAKEERERLRWLRHRLFEDFVPARNAVDRLSFHKDLSGELHADIRYARNQYDNLQCLLEYMTDRTDEGSPLPRSLPDMLERIKLWLTERSTRNVEFDGKMSRHTYSPALARALYMVLSNLVHNATKFSERSGSIYLSCAESESCVQVIIDNSGRQMDAAWRQYLSGQDDTPPTHRGRTPEGLQTVKWELQKHGLPRATVAVPSPRYGNGTRIIVAIPSRFEA